MASSGWYTNLHWDLGSGLFSCRQHDIVLETLYCIDYKYIHPSTKKYNSPSICRVAALKPALNPLSIILPKNAAAKIIDTIKIAWICLLASYPSRQKLIPSGFGLQGNSTVLTLTARLTIVYRRHVSRAAERTILADIIGLHLHPVWGQSAGGGVDAITSTSLVLFLPNLGGPMDALLGRRATTPSEANNPSKQLRRNRVDLVMVEDSMHGEGAASEDDF